MQFTDRGKIGSSAFAKNIEVKHLNMYTFELVQVCLQVHAPKPGFRLIKCMCTFKSKTILYFQHVQFTLLFIKNSITMMKPSVHPILIYLLNHFQHCIFLFYILSFISSRV